MFVLPLTRSAVPASYRAAFLPQTRTTIDRLFDDSFDRVFGTSPALRTPAMDVAETDSAYTVTLEMPGVSREQLKVSVHGRRLTVETVDVPKADETVKTEGDEATGAAGTGDTGRAVSPGAPKHGSRMLYRERVEAKFARTVSLPVEVDQASSEARFENGVLTLTLAKKVPTGATQISIA